MEKKKAKNNSRKEKKKVLEKKISQSEFEKKVLELQKQGLTSERIGEGLRREGIYPKSYGKKISKILKEKKLYENPDLKNTEEKLKKIREHLEKNKKDKRALREGTRIAAKVRKLKQYLKMPTR